MSTVTTLPPGCILGSNIWVHLDKESFVLCVELPDESFYEEPLSIESFPHCETKEDVCELIDECLENKRYSCKDNIITLSILVLIGKRSKTYNVDIVLEHKKMDDFSVERELKKKIRDMEVTIEELKKELALVKERQERFFEYDLEYENKLFDERITYLHGYPSKHEFPTLKEVQGLKVFSGCVISQYKTDGLSPYTTSTIYFSKNYMFVFQNHWSCWECKTHEIPFNVLFGIKATIQNKPENLFHCDTVLKFSKFFKKSLES
jgi:hypothetical protein